MLRSRSRARGEAEAEAEGLEGEERLGRACASPT